MGDGAVRPDGAMSRDTTPRGHRLGRCIAPNETMAWQRSTGGVARPGGPAVPGKDRAAMTYVVRTRTQVPVTSINQFLSYIQASDEVLARASGFQVRRVLRSLGYPTQYQSLWFWDSSEAAETFALGSVWQDFLGGTPVPGTVTSIEAYEVVVDVGEGSADVTRVGLAELTRGSEVDHAEFVRVRDELFRLMQRHEPRLVRSRLLRFLGGADRYLAVHASTRELDREFGAIPELAAFYEQYPNSRYLTAPPSAEWFTPARVLVPV
jgi:hypothetical protein